jgi:hypothetical protein
VPQSAMTRSAHARPVGRFARGVEKVGGAVGRPLEKVRSLVRATGIPSWVFKAVWVPASVAGSIWLAVNDSATFILLLVIALLPFPPFTRRSKRKPKTADS